MFLFGSIAGMMLILLAQQVLIHYAARNRSRFVNLIEDPRYPLRLTRHEHLKLKRHNPEYAQAHDDMYHYYRWYARWGIRR